MYQFEIKENTHNITLSLMSFRSSIISQSHSKFWKNQHVWVQLSLPKSFVCLWTPIGEKKQTVVLFSVSSRSNPLCAQDGTGMV